MILADTSIWIDHFRQGDDRLAACLDAGDITCNLLVVAEIALGSVHDRDATLGLLDQLPSVPRVAQDEIRALIETRRLFSRGIGYVDTSLIAPCLLAPGTML